MSNVHPLASPCSRLGFWLIYLALLALPVTGRLRAETDSLPDPARLVTLAQDQFESGRFDSAMALADSALDRDSTLLEGWLLRSHVYRARNLAAEAANALSRVLTLYPGHTESQLRLAHALLDTGLSDSAARCLSPRHLRSGPWQPYSLYLQARVFASQGLIDSAVTLYNRAFTVMDYRDLLYLPIVPDNKLQAINLYSLDQGIIERRTTTQSLILLWATWSQSSLEALSDIVEQLPKAGISYQFLPINVDAAALDVDDTVRIANAADGAGYTDTVWFDQQLTLLTEWAVIRIPAVIVIRLNGAVDLVSYDWDAPARERILSRYLAPYTDTTREPVSSTDASLTKARSLLGAARVAWRGPKRGEALKRLTQAIAEAPAYALLYLQQADWRWHRGDTLGARMAVDQAWAADSADSWSQFAAARVAYWHGRYERSLGLLRQCLARDSMFVPAWKLYGVLSARQGDLAAADSALAVLDRLMRVSPVRTVIRAMIASAKADPDHAKLWQKAVEMRLSTASASRHHWTPAP